MKNLIAIFLFLSSISAFSMSNQQITADVNIQFSCIIPGHGGGCSLETYKFNAHPNAETVKVFTTFLEDGELQTHALESINTNYIYLYTSENDQFPANAIRIGKKKTSITSIFFDVNGSFIDAKTEVLHTTFELEY
ncbi:hypothetical protein BIY24_10005 [Halobacteriovorax marinus]|uniref:Lipoprotein n=1 Tax=Halobacteriovorax marinus (strain ATCC BAA-682 / DSM 15412 / SJ) TaxID=862908 RepID=E1X3L8_HALMS|nr:hypothetical protein [Halobacteriovorax marinus]ATH08270.1 hypothetical protein BIY24_10005 [Halobacteriovorax marinus]CBW26947.1 hypothetical protein BMS_2141 [Halobacteriovorax marinus SJ]